jgi:hypothetical protein
MDEIALSSFHTQHTDGTRRRPQTTNRAQTLTLEVGELVARVACFSRQIVFNILSFAFVVDLTATPRHVHTRARRLEPQPETRSRRYSRVQPWLLCHSLWRHRTLA